MSQLKENLAKIRATIADSCKIAQRNPQEVTLLAVSKTKPAEAIKEAYQAGQIDFGENYLQEALQKIEALKDLPLSWHFIGSIQSNKTRPIAENFDWVHTLSSLKQARRINDQRPADLPPINACIQVNISKESSKSGVSVEETADLAKEITKLKHIHLRGLMAIPVATDDIDVQRQAFRSMSDLLSELNEQGLSLDTLSMGMSGDLAIAIEEGSTMVRIGTAIFGKRESMT